MSQIAAHPHAEFDRFPMLAEEFGSAFVDAVVEAEAADFAWDSRFAERDLGAWESLDDDDDGGQLVRIIGYFHGRYLVATCIVDDRRRVTAMVTKQCFDDFENALQAFLGGGG